MTRVSPTDFPRPVAGRNMLRSFLAICLLCLCTVAGADRAIAQDYAKLWRTFDAQRLTLADKRFLQVALAFEGRYSGLIDGDWGRLSQSAMAEFSQAEFGVATEDWHMAVLALKFFERYDREGWQVEYFPSSGISLLVPQNSLISDPPSDKFVNWRHAGSSLSYSVGIFGRDGAQRLHDYTLKRHTWADEPYSIRKPNLAVSTSTDGNGVILYTRSDYVSGLWTTVMLSANQQDKATLMAVAASISPRQERQFAFTPGGALDVAIETALSLASEADSAEQVARGNPDNDRSADGDSGSVGSGFTVSEHGHVLTNAHVVDDCDRIIVDGNTAELVKSSEDFDLALLMSPASRQKSVAVFSAGPAKLNSDVTVVGYPYGGLLSGLNVTRGSVSSLSGLAGDAFTMQITAPVQTGNSGGPLLGPGGEVVGVIVSKLDALKFADLLGDLPQNVNYAVRGEIAKLFLAQNGVEPKLSLTDLHIDPVEIAERASKFTLFVECKK